MCFSETKCDVQQNVHKKNLKVNKCTIKVTNCTFHCLAAFLLTFDYLCVMQYGFGTLYTYFSRTGLFIKSEITKPLYLFYV